MARTGLTMGDVWTGTICVKNHTTGENPIDYGLKPPCDIVGISAIGGSATITNSGPSGDTRYFSFTGGPGVGWTFKTYWPFVVAVSAGIGSTDSVQVFYQYNEVVYPPGPPPAMGGPSIPADAIVVSSLEVDVTISVSGIFAGAEITDATYDDRESPKDFTDRTLATSWYADEDTSRTVTAVVPGYGTLTATSTGLGYAPGVIDVEPHEIGGNFSAGWGFAMNRAPVVNTVYAAIDGPSCGGGLVNLGYLDLCKPGTGDQPPDAVTPGWYFSPPASGGYWHVFNSGGIAIERKTATTTSAENWTGYTSMPYICNLVFNDGAFNDLTANSLSIDYDCGAVEYIDGEYVTHYFTGDEEWNEFHSDWDPPGWRRWNSERVVSPMEKNEWRAANKENVGGGAAAQNDARAGMKIYPVNRSDWNAETLGSLVWQMLTVSMLESINVNEPADLLARPSLWTFAYGGMANGLNNDIWECEPNITAPLVKRIFKTRYWLRLNNLQGYAEDPELPRDYNWPIMMRPNINLNNNEDGAVIAAAVPGEDEFHWAQYAYMLFGITSPRVGKVVMTVKYSTVNVSDPCYPSVAYRADEWEYTRSQFTATYEFNITAGANNIQIDLAAPTGGETPFLWHVDEVWFQLPDTGEWPETYTLTQLALTRDTEQDPTLLFRSVRCWQWSENKGFGVGAVVDGKDALWVGDAYGYGAHTNEKKLSYIQYAQHNPTSSLSDDPSTAKSLARLINEINWLRGWVATYEIQDPCEYTEDEDGNSVTGSFYWWDLQEAHETSETSRRGSPTVGYWELLAGTPQTIHVEKYPRGAIHGIAKDTGDHARVRNAASGVIIYGRDTGGTWSQIEDCGTDGQGRFCSSPVKELDRQYRVGETGGTLTVTNREYSRDIQLVPREGGEDAVAMFSHPSGFMKYAVVLNGGGEIKLYRLDNAQTNAWVELSTIDSSESYDAVAGEHDGTTIHVLARLQESGEFYQWWTQTEGEDYYEGGVLHSGWHGPTAI